MSKFWDLLEESVIVQAMVTLIAVSTICYLYVSQQPVPETLTAIVMLILGYYFGSKQQMYTMKGRGK